MIDYDWQLRKFLYRNFLTAFLDVVVMLITLPSICIPTRTFAYFFVIYKHYFHERKNFNILRVLLLNNLLYACVDILTFFPFVVDILLITRWLHVFPFLRYFCCIHEKWKSILQTQLSMNPNKYGNNYNEEKKQEKQQHTDLELQMQFNSNINASHNFQIDGTSFMKNSTYGIAQAIYLKSSDKEVNISQYDIVRIVSNQPSITTNNVEMVFIENLNTQQQGYVPKNKFDIQIKLGIVKKIISTTK